MDGEEAIVKKHLEYCGGQPEARGTAGNQAGQTHLNFQYFLPVTVGHSSEPHFAIKANVL